MFDSFENAWKSIIKAPNTEYSPQDLGKQRQNIRGHEVDRSDFSFTNRDGFKLQVSLFQKTESPSKSCMIYLHSHSGNRLEGLPILEHLVPDLSFCVLDFAGCGNSGGTHVTLGI